MAEHAKDERVAAMVAPLDRVDETVARVRSVGVRHEPPFRASGEAARPVGQFARECERRIGALAVSPPPL